MTSNTGAVEAVLLASGGLDSTVLAYWLADRGVKFIPLFLSYGQHCRGTELSRLKRLLPPESISALTVLELGNVYHGSASRMITEADLWTEHVSADDLYLPYRNLMFLSVAAAFAQARGFTSVYSAFINSNHAKEIDCSAEFFKRLELVFMDYGAVRLEMPFRDMSKADVAKIGLDLDVKIGQTYSCQVSSEVPCGVCPNCVDRIAALASIEEVDSATGTGD